jgi:hypothetical protein
VITAHGRVAVAAHPVAALLGLRTVIHQVAQAEQVIEGLARDDLPERRVVPVDVRDDKDAHESNISLLCAREEIRSSITLFSR